jgi:hypothetical protein
VNLESDDGMLAIIFGFLVATGLFVAGTAWLVRHQ